MLPSSCDRSSGLDRCYHRVWPASFLGDYLLAYCSQLCFESENNARFHLEFPLSADIDIPAVEIKFCLPPKFHFLRIRLLIDSCFEVVLKLRLAWVSLYAAETEPTYRPRASGLSDELYVQSYSYGIFARWWILTRLRLVAAKVDAAPRKDARASHRMPPLDKDPRSRIDVLNTRRIRWKR